MGDAVSGRVGTVAATRALIRCPHCTAGAIIRSSEQVTPTIKDLYLHCTNTDCGHTWKAQIAPVYTICPSHLPNPAIQILACPPEYLRQRPKTSPMGFSREGDPDQMLMFPPEAPQMTEGIAAPPGTAAA